MKNVLSKLQCIPFVMMIAILAILNWTPAAAIDDLLPAEDSRSEAKINTSERKVRTGRVLVLANRNFPDSLEIANAYIHKRGLPPANLLLIDVDNPISVNPGTFSEEIMDPVRERLEMLEGRVDYIMITRGVPYRVKRKSTAAALMFNGFDRIRKWHGFFGQEREFDGSIPVFGNYLYPTTALITYTVEDALNLIERSSVSYPSPEEAGRFYFCEGAGPRGVRNNQIRGGIRMASKRGGNATRVANHLIRNRDDIMGQVTGTKQVHLESNKYLPGSILDNLTSYGGYLLKEMYQTGVTTFIQHGVCGGYGTVVEPTNNLTRWAQLSLFGRYLAGFNLADIYLQTIRDVSLGVVVGDPLMAPFAETPEIKLKSRIDSDFDNVYELLVEVSAAEGDQRGLAWAELWLNDEIPAGTLIPALTAGTRVSFTVQAGDRRVFQEEYRLLDDQPLHKVIGRIVKAANGEEGLEIRQAGRYGGKALVRMAPELLKDGPAAVNIQIQKDEKNYSRSLPLGTISLAGKVGIMNFSGNAASSGDAVWITVADEMIVAHADGPKSAADMADLVAERLVKRHPKFGEDGEWLVEKATDEKLIVVNREKTSGKTIPVTVHIQKSPRSSFASKITDGRIPWRKGSVGAVGETVIEPFLPNSEMRRSIAFAADSLAVGFNRFHVRARCPGGAENYSILDFINDRPGRSVPEVELNNNTFSLGDDIKMRIDLSEWLGDAVPRLFVNGRPAAAFEPGSREISFTLNMPAVAPGRNEVWLEWTDASESEFGLFPRRQTPLARAKPLEIMVKRPLAAGVELESRVINAESNNEKLKLQGPYLHSRVKAVIKDHSFSLKRDSDFGLRWEAELPPFPKGDYEIRLVGLPEQDEEMIVPVRLKVKSSETEKE